ncbi:MAG: MFS transporter [Rhodobacteraceae bacterium]|nr:MFS transporter [Paracoccaceae bacterium]
MSQTNTPVYALAVGQTLTYAGVYYAFPAILPDLLAETGWTAAELAAGPTLGFLVMAALTPFTGRWVDRGWGGELLGYMPVLAALCVAALGFAPTLGWWLAIWAVLGLAQATCLYETCFAFLTRRLGEDARLAITRVTLVAGFSGTLTFPLGDFLARNYGAQGALIGFALLILFGAVPVNIWAVRALRRMERASAPRPHPRDPGALHAALRRPAFWAISAIFGMIWLNHGVLLTFILMLFQDRGASAGMATIAAACIGPSQVAGRALLLVFAARVSNARASLWSLASILVAGVILWVAGVLPALIFVFAMLQGAGAGLLSNLRPILVADLLGRRGFGTVSGAVAVTPILASAAAPSVGAALLHAGGPGLIYGACLAMAAGGLAIGIGLLARSPR